MSFCSILRDHLDAFRHDYARYITPAMEHAIDAMLRCRTENAQRSQWHCAHCSVQTEFPLSCGHRNCPQCLHQATSDWLAKQQAKLLPVRYFMVTFTVPNELRFLARTHPNSFYHALFCVAASVLKSFAARSKQLGGEIGFTGVLHTHNRRRELHPHIHFIVPAGCYNKQKQHWCKNRGKYLFNEFNLAKVWRARLIDYIAHHPILTLPDQLPTQWVVDCRYVKTGLPALQYLSRYLYKGVLADSDILSEYDGQVSFAYQDYQTKARCVRTLPATAFIWLILQHVLPKGFRRVRDYGLLSGSCHALRLRIQRFLMSVGYTFAALQPPKRSMAVRACPCCDKPMQFMGIRSRPTLRRPSAIST